MSNAELLDSSWWVQAIIIGIAAVFGTAAIKLSRVVWCGVLVLKRRLKMAKLNRTNPGFWAEDLHIVDATADPKLAHAALRLACSNLWTCFQAAKSYINNHHPSPEQRKLLRKSGFKAICKKHGL